MGSSWVAETEQAHEMRLKARDPIASERALAALRHARSFVRPRSFSLPRYQEAAEAYLVAADVLEEEGKYDLALGAKERAKALFKEARSKEQTLSPKRTKRIYEYHRRHGKPAQEAFRLAKAQREERIVGHIGDVNWLEYGGGPIIKKSDGSYHLEYVVPPEEAGRKRYFVYHIDLDKERFPDWVDAQDVAETMDISPTILRRNWNSPSVLKRALAREHIANYYGWENFDDSPDRLTRREIQTHYRKSP